MEQFSLEKWLQDKSRKVITRDGRPVRILCTDAKAKDGCCIIAAIETDGEEEGYQFFKNGKAYSSKSSIEDCADLFFADEEDKLTEFEKAVKQVMWTAYNYDDCSNGKDVDDISNIKATSKSLLDLARKEIRKEQQEKLGTLEMPIDVTEPYYIKGKEDALKDLPKWKKANKETDFEERVLIYEDDYICYDDHVYIDDYYIERNELKKLPKE